MLWLKFFFLAQVFSTQVFIKHEVMLKCIQALRVILWQGLCPEDRRKNPDDCSAHLNFKWTECKSSWQLATLAQVCLALVFLALHWRSWHWQWTGLGIVLQSAGAGCGRRARSGLQYRQQSEAEDSGERSFGGKHKNYIYSTLMGSAAFKLLRVNIS